MLGNVLNCLFVSTKKLKLGEIRAGMLCAILERLWPVEADKQASSAARMKLGRMVSFLEDPSKKGSEEIRVS